MNIPILNFEKVIDQFYVLDNIVVDTSSLIAAKKAGFLEELTAHLSLHTVSDVFIEYGDTVPSVELLHLNEPDLTTDQKVVELAKQIKYPVLSEDKAILNAAKLNNLDFYNAGMMLEYLFYKNVVDENEYQANQKLLGKNSRYSNGIINYIKQLHDKLVL